MDGSFNLHVAGQCLPILEPTVGETDRHCSLDVLPILFEDDSYPLGENCAFQNGHDEDLYSIPTVLEDGAISPRCTPPVTLLSFIEFPVLPKGQMVDPPLKPQNFKESQKHNEDSQMPCVIDIDTETKKFESRKFDEAAVGGIKNESKATGMLQRQLSMKTCGRLMQLFTDHDSMLLKLISREKSFNERSLDIANNRWRRYKRAASFDSRKIVLLFSILSSLGTLVLIYLTLRVRQNTEGLVNI